MPVAGTPTINDFGWFPDPGFVNVGDPVLYHRPSQSSYSKMPARPLHRQQLAFRGVSRVVKRADKKDHPVLQMGPFSTPRFVREQPFTPVVCRPEDLRFGLPSPLPWKPSVFPEHWCRLAHAHHHHHPIGNIREQPATVTPENKLTERDRIFMWVVTLLMDHYLDDELHELTDQEIDDVWAMRGQCPPFAREMDLTFESASEPVGITPIVVLGYTLAQMDGLLYY